MYNQSRPQSPRSNRDKPRVESPQVAQLFSGHNATRANRFKVLISGVYRQDIGIVLNMSPAKLDALADGRLNIDAELATFIESELGLPGGYLDGKAEGLPTALTEQAEEIAEVSMAPTTKVHAPEVPAAPQSVRPSATLRLPPKEPRAAVPNSTAAERVVLSQAPVVNQADPHASLTQPAPTVTVKTKRKPGRPSEGSDASTPKGQLRVQNLVLLTEGRGYKSALSKITGIQGSYVSRLLAVGTEGFRPLSDNQARRVEKDLGLPKNWFDKSQVEIPEFVRNRMEALILRRGDGGIAARAKRESERAATVSQAAPTPPAPLQAERAAKPAVAPVAPKVATPEVAPITPTPAVPSPVEAVAVASPAPALVASPAPLSVAVAVAPPAGEAQTTLMADILLKALTQRVMAGSLSDKAAYKMLGALLDA